MLNFSDSSTPKTRSALAIFCRAPRLGTVKTRIAQTRGDEFALGLYRAMLDDTFALGRALAPEVETFACFTPADGFEGEDSLAPLWDGPRLTQCDGDLGAKILDCFAQLRARGFEKIVVIGSDSPDLPQSAVPHALKNLDEFELVFGESPDGGFCVIGASVSLPDRIFDEVVWSSDSVYSRLLANLHQATSKPNYCIITSWRDVDDEADLIELRRRIFELGTYAPLTRAFLEKNEPQRHGDTEEKRVCIS